MLISTVSNTLQDVQIKQKEFGYNLKETRQSENHQTNSRYTYYVIYILCNIGFVIRSYTFE